MEEIWQKVVDWASTAGIKLLVTLLCVFIGFKLINWLAKKIEKGLLKSGKIDKTILFSLIHAGKIILKIVIAIALIGYLGIDTSAITALLASAGVCFGLAVNGSVANLAGGIVLLCSRPFKVDDYIEVAGFTGTVDSIRLISTRLITSDYKTVYIPNATISNAPIINHSERGVRRQTFVFSAPADADITAVRTALEKVVDAFDIDNPASSVFLSARNDKTSQFTCQLWMQEADYDGLKQSFPEAAIAALTEEGVTLFLA